MGSGRCGCQTALAVGIFVLVVLVVLVLVLVVCLELVRPLYAISPIGARVASLDVAIVIVSLANFIPVVSLVCRMPVKFVCLWI